MKIVDIKEPIIFVGLKSLSRALINDVWRTSFGTGEAEAEFNLVVLKTKKFEKDIKKFAQINTDLNWGQRKKKIGKKHWAINHEGDFNPWYSGKLDLEDFIDSLEPLVEFIQQIDTEMQYAEFIHYFEFLKTKAGLNSQLITNKYSPYKDIERMKTVLVDVATGRARIQDENKEYKQIYSKVDEYFTSLGLKNPNKYSDLWEFYVYWKKHLKTYVERRVFITKIYKNIPTLKKNAPVIKLKFHPYVNQNRLAELKGIKNKNFDLSKLIRYCEEIKLAFINQSYFSVAMLLRSIINHVPPIFGCKTFLEVVNNYKGPQSFKNSMKYLNNSLRKIADSYLHIPIRKKESLPNLTQVDYSPDLDTLLAEICRLLK